MENSKISHSKTQQIVFTLSLFVVLFIAAISYRHVNILSDSSEKVAHTYEVNLELERLFSYIKDSENSMRGFLISDDTIYLDPYYKANSNINYSFIKLKKLLNDNKKQQNNLEELYEVVKRRLDNNDYYIDTDKKISVEQSKSFKKNFYENNKLLVRIRNKINEMSDLEDSYLIKRNTEHDKQVNFTPIFTIIILFITIIIIFYSQSRMNKNIKNLRKINSDLLKSNFLNQQAEILSDFGTWEWDLQTQETTYSDNFYRILGYEPKLIPSTNENFLNLIHQDDKDLVLGIMNNVVENEDLPSTPYRIIKPDGEIRTFSVMGKLFYDNKNNKSILGVTHDITDQVKNSEMLKNHIANLKKLNGDLKIHEESAKQAEILGKYGTWVLNFENESFSYSDNKYRLMGYEPQEFIPTIEALLDHVHEDDKQIVIDANEKALTTFEIPTMNYRIITKKGEIRRFKTIAKSYTDKNGTDCMIGTTQDITEDYEKSKLLSERNSELEQNIKELNEFNHVASHDLQEPLRKIQTFISRIKDKEADNLSDFGKDYMLRIEKASNRMRVLINDLLQYSRTNRSDKNFIDVDLNEVLENTLAELSQTIEDKNATIDYSKLITVQGVDFQLHQLFINLVSNSLKYSKADIAPIIKITGTSISASTEPLLKDKSNRKYYKVTFKDNGIGFEQENAEKIFLLFNRLHGKTEFQGTGVGLAICKKIIENHNGTIYATGKPGVGATFTIYLPLSN